MSATYSALSTTAIMLFLYLIAGFAIKDRWEQKIIINPLKIIASSSSGKASLSSAQVFFFTLIVLWLVLYWIFQEEKLVTINDSVLKLLGIAIVGSGLGRVSDTTRFRATAENWAWAKKKKWIKKNFTRSSPKRTPRFGDLLTTDHGFDIARFQAVGFTLLVGIAMFYSGCTAQDATGFSNFSIDDKYLILIGISQGAYVGGKFVGSDLFKELNNILKEARALEVTFMKAVANSSQWKNAHAANKNLSLASTACAPGEYIEYMRTTEEACVIVESMTGNSIDSAHIEPALPV